MSLSPQLIESYQQAKQSMARGDFRKAADLCKSILDSDPQCAQGYQLMSELFKNTGNLDKAVAFADLAIKHDPDMAELYAWMAELQFYKKDYAKAENMAAQALAKKPDDKGALSQMLAALMQQKKLTEAKEVMRRLLDVYPDDPNTAYFKAVLNGVTIENAPQKFVETLFDQFAPVFDEHLQQNLSYKTPILVADRLRAMPTLQGKTSLRLLDLGCGTGLVAEALKDMTSQRIGVDLSQNMLDHARSKQLYDELHKRDIVEFMAADGRIFDVVVAADVFVYVGDLTPVFTALDKVLPVGGFFAFSIEKEEGGAAFGLSPNQRYRHSVPYILSLAKRYGYDIAVSEDCTLRTEKTEPVKGMIYILTKTQKS